MFPVWPKPLILSAPLPAVGEVPPNNFLELRIVQATAPKLPMNVRRVHFKLNAIHSLRLSFYLFTMAAVQLISTKESPGKFATATVVLAGPPLGKLVLKTLFMPS